MRAIKIKLCHLFIAILLGLLTICDTFQVNERDCPKTIVVDHTNFHGISVQIHSNYCKALYPMRTCSLSFVQGNFLKQAEYSLCVNISFPSGQISKNRIKCLNHLVSISGFDPYDFTREENMCGLGFRQSEKTVCLKPGSGMRLLLRSLNFCDFNDFVSLTISVQTKKGTNDNISSKNCHLQRSWSEEHGDTLVSDSTFWPKKFPNKCEVQLEPGRQKVDKFCFFFVRGDFFLGGPILHIKGFFMFWKFGYVSPPVIGQNICYSPTYSSRFNVFLEHDSSEENYNHSFILKYFYVYSPIDPSTTTSPWSTDDDPSEEHSLVLRLLVCVGVVIGVMILCCTCCSCLRAANTAHSRLATFNGNTENVALDVAREPYYNKNGPGARGIQDPPTFVHSTRVLHGTSASDRPHTSMPMPSQREALLSNRNWSGAAAYPEGNRPAVSSTRHADSIRRSPEGTSSYSPHRVEVHHSRHYLNVGAQGGRADDESTEWSQVAIRDDRHSPEPPPPSYESLFHT